MRDHSQELKGVPLEFLNLVAERCVDGIVIVDDKFRIRLASQMIVNEFAREGQESLHDTDYFETFFGFNLDFRKNGNGGLTQAKITKAKEKIPMYKAITTGIVDDGVPPPTIATPNDIAYQVETRVAAIQHEGNTVRVALEFWRHMGDPEVFKYDEDFVSFREKN